MYVCMYVLNKKNRVYWNLTGILFGLSTSVCTEIFLLISRPISTFELKKIVQQHCLINNVATLHINIK